MEITSKEKKKYRTTKKWKDFRTEMLELSDNTCFVCEIKKKKGLVIHHLNSKSYKEETDRDIVVLCSSCHKELHRVLRRNIFNVNVYAINFKKVFYRSIEV